MPFISPESNELNVKLVVYGPDPVENVRRLTEMHARIGAAHEAKLRRVRGDGKVFDEGATVVFFDVPVPVPPFYGHPVRMHLYAMEGAPTLAHQRVAFAGLDGLIFVPGAPGAGADASLDALKSLIVSLGYALPTAVVEAKSPDEDVLALVDAALAEVFRIFQTHLVKPDEPG